MPKALLARLALLGQTVRKDLRGLTERKGPMGPQALTAHQAPWDPSALQVRPVLLEDRALGQMERVLSRPWQTWG